MEEGSRRRLTDPPAVWLSAPEAASAGCLLVPERALDSMSAEIEFPHTQQAAGPGTPAVCISPASEQLLNLRSARASLMLAGGSDSLPAIAGSQHRAVSGERNSRVEAPVRAPLVVFGRSITLGSAAQVCRWHQTLCCHAHPGHRFTAAINVVTCRRQADTDSGRWSSWRQRRSLLVDCLPLPLAL